MYKSISYPIVLLTLASFSPNMYGATHGALVTCSGNIASFVTSCQAKIGVLEEGTPIESTYEFSYDMSCDQGSGAKSPSPLQLKVGSDTFPILYSNTEALTIDSTDNIQLDFAEGNSQTTLGKILFKSGCSLTVEINKIIPSLTIRDEWRQDLENINENIRIIESSISVGVQALDLYEAINTLDHLTKSLVDASNATNFDDLKSKVPDARETITKMITDGKVTFLEVTAFIELLNALDMLADADDVNDMGDASDLFKKHISPEDLAAVQKVLDAEKTQYLAIKNQIAANEQLLAAKKIDLSQVQAKMSDYGVEP